MPHVALSHGLPLALARGLHPNRSSRRPLLRVSPRARARAASQLCLTSPSLTGFPSRLREGCIPTVPHVALSHGLPLALARGLHPNRSSRRPLLRVSPRACARAASQPVLTTPSLTGFPSRLREGCIPTVPHVALSYGFPLALARGLHPNCASRRPLSRVSPRACARAASQPVLTSPSLTGFPSRSREGCIPTVPHVALSYGFPLALARGLYPNCASRRPL
ncbi:MAG: hypothetical protein KatS3mg005_1891 [Bryobacteraceae bacterium]|nr:MAG: hypothetical protein KatS3mg005_1891 [Bryobacteraceae bacterium]